jgi:tetratricopeptide (TPR) repeat protein
LLGNDEADEPEGAEAIGAGVDPFAATIALARSESGGQVTGDLAAYLRQLTRLTGRQLEHLGEQRVLNVSRLRVRLWRERLQLGLQILVTAIVAVVVLAVLDVFHRAVTSHQVIIESFDTPPALEARGLSGKVVAGDLLDALTRLQAATRATARKRDIASAWEQDVKIEVPETGVSIGEIDRLLRARFGHDQHVTGEVVQEPDGRLSLRIRGQGANARAFVGAQQDVDKLVTSAAEYIYGEDEPFLFAVYLNQSGRAADAEAFVSAAYPTAPPADRGALANVWGNAVSAQGRYADAGALYRMAIKDDPRLWSAWSNLIGVASIIEGEEAAWRIGERMRQVARTAAQGDQPTLADWQNLDPLTQDWTAERAALDFDANRMGGQGTSDVADGPSLAEAAGRLHDWATADRYLLSSDPNDPHTKAERLFIEGYQALDAAKPAAAVQPLMAFEAMMRANVALGRDFYGDYACYLGSALGLSGKTAEAEGVFDRAGRWLSCYGFRADALDRAGDWPGAQAAYANAVASAPDLPFAYDRWGLALTRRGDLVGALAKFAQAHQRGPHWADPLKHWGDSLMMLGRRREAAERYAEAAKYAPAWADLREAARRVGA